MMQSRRLHQGSSGELDVFRATSYFAGGLLPDDSRVTDHEPSPADRRLFQAKVMLQRDTNTMEGSSPHRHVVLVPQRQLGLGVQNQHQHQQVVVAKQQQPSSGNKSKLAALLSFMVSPSPRSSFRKEAAPSPTRLQLQQTEAAASAAGAGDEPAACNYYKAAGSSSSSRESSMRLLKEGLFGAHGYDDDDDDLDLGVATGDRRLQGITVVRGGEERWVVRCVRGACWDDQEQCREKTMLVDASESSSSSHEKSKQDEVEEGDDDGDGNREGHCWDSDSSSDLFDLNLEYMCADDLPSTT